jgi:hypothetical protein
MRFSNLVIFLIIFLCSITITTAINVSENGTWNYSTWSLPQPAAPLNSCPGSTTTGAMMLFFILFVIFGIFILNLLVLKLPILNLLPAAGLIVFGFTLFYCAWYLAFICWMLGIGIVVMMFGEV